MSRKKCVVCDQCDKILSVDSPYPHNFVLELKVVDTGINTSGATYAIHQEPAFQGSRHFCDNECLIKWVKRNN